MYWQGYTRDRAARDFLSVSNRLSNGAWIYRPLDPQVQQQAIEDLSRVRDGLLKLGYAHDSFVSVTVSHIILVLQHRPQPSFDVMIDLSQHLLQAARFLSTPSSPFPVPNRHLPPEILHLIYDYVILDRDVREREKTLFALSTTSILWRKIVDERPVVLLDSLRRLGLYEDFCLDLKEIGSTRWRQPLEEVHINFSKEDPDDVYDVWWGSVERLLDSRAKNKSGRYTGKVVMALPTDEDWPLSRWASQFMEKTSQWDRVTVRIDSLSEQDHEEIWRLLYLGKVGPKEERSYHFNSAKPILLDTTITQTMLDRASQTNGGKGSVPVFTDYTEFVAPWLVFTVPIFLLETVQEELRPQNLLPSRLDYLAITLQVDPSNPPEAIRHIESFFSAISPQIEVLVFRLRITSPHPSAFQESKFTQRFISSLYSCTKLRHLEVGGLGFSPDFLSRISILPFKTLTILPLQHVRNYNHYLPLIYSAQKTQSARVLKVARLDVPDRLDHYIFVKLCSDDGVELSTKECQKERVMWKTLANAAGVDWA
ncbi:hypothetical protein JCM3765_007635 [Sporobolomyces pararoseus]